MATIQVGLRVAAVGALALSCAAASAGSKTIRFNDYDGNEFNDPAYSFQGAVGAAVPIDVGAYAGLGAPGVVFSGQMLWDNGPLGDSGMGGSFTNLPLGGTVSFSFLMAAIDGWAGNNVSKGGPDRFQLLINGNLAWSTAISNFTLTSNNGGRLAGSGMLGGNPRLTDSAWDFTNEPMLQNIAYTGTTLNFAFRAAGDGWEGGPHETWGVDNFRVVLNAPAVPEPATTALWLAGAGCVGLLARRRRRA